MDLVKRWFAELTTKWLRRGTHRSVKELVASIRTWITNWNDDSQTLRMAQDRRRDPATASLPIASGSLTQDTSQSPRRHERNSQNLWIDFFR
jgi:hypothetical protein